MSTRTFFELVSALQQAVINVSSSGDSTLVAGAAGKTIKVYRLKLIVSAATAILIKSDSATTLDGPLSFSANEGMILDFTGNDMPPWYTTAAGKDLVINSSNAVTIGGNLDYLLS